MGKVQVETRATPLFVENGILASPKKLKSALVHRPYCV